MNAIELAFELLGMAAVLFPSHPKEFERQDFLISLNYLTLKALYFFYTIAIKSGNSSGIRQYLNLQNLKELKKVALFKSIKSTY